RSKLPDETQRRAGGRHRSPRRRRFRTERGDAVLGGRTDRSGNQSGSGLCSRPVAKAIEDDVPFAGMRMSMRPVIVINVLGLSPIRISPDTRHLAQLSKRGALRPLMPVFPAVTCPVQASFLTGTIPAQHGIVANGWYFRDLSEIWFWRQSNRLIAGERVWDAPRRRDSRFTCANLFWWYNMYAAADIGGTPRPIYLAGGGKLPDFVRKPRGMRGRV